MLAKIARSVVMVLVTMMPSFSGAVMTNMRLLQPSIDGPDFVKSP